MKKEGRHKLSPNMLTMYLLIKPSLQLPSVQEHTGDYYSACCTPGLPKSFLQSSYLFSWSQVCSVVWGNYNPGAGLWFVIAEVHEVLDGMSSLWMSLWMVVQYSSIISHSSYLLSPLGGCSMLSFRSLTKNSDSISDTDQWNW